MQFKSKTDDLELAKEKRGHFLCCLFCLKEIFVLSPQCIVYWIHFQNIHTFTYEKILLNTLFCLFIKSSNAFSVSLSTKSIESLWLLWWWRTVWCCESNKWMISKGVSITWSNGLVVKVLDSQSRGPIFKKPLGGSKVNSAFHPSEVDKMSTRNFWELSGKK